MLAIAFLLVRCAAVLAEEKVLTWVNNHPELERILSEGVNESVSIYDKVYNDTISVDDLYHKQNLNEATVRVVDGTKGEVRKMKSIVRLNGTNITWVDERHRVVSFFVSLKVMEITYKEYNQSNFDFYKVGSLVVMPSNNLIQVNCSVAHETTPAAEWYARVENVSLVSVDKVLIRVITKGPSPKFKWLVPHIVNELTPTILNAIRPSFERNVRNTLDQALQKRGLSKFFNDYFKSNVPETQASATTQTYRL